MVLELGASLDSQLQLRLNKLSLSLRAIHMLELLLRLRSAIVLELFGQLEYPGCLECLCKLRELLRTLEIGFTLRSSPLYFSVDDTQQASHHHLNLSHSFVDSSLSTS